MTHRMLRAALVLTAGLAITSCNQAATPAQEGTTATGGTPATAPAVGTITTYFSPEQQASLRRDIAELRTFQGEVAAGKRAAPTDDTGKPIDLDALLGSLEKQLALADKPLPTGAQGAGLQAQAVYPVQRYYDISATDFFRSNYSGLRAGSPAFNWSTDGCSAPWYTYIFNYISAGAVSLGASQFYWACVQHDFGYRNAKAYPSLLNEWHRGWVDSQFLRHMYQTCTALYGSNYSGLSLCFARANGFYSGVVAGGWSAFY